MENIITIEIINRGLIDKRRTHLEDVYIMFEHNKLERVATYNKERKTLTFYHFEHYYKKVWKNIDLLKYINNKVNKKD